MRNTKGNSKVRERVGGSAPGARADIHHRSLGRTQAGAGGYALKDLQHNGQPLPEQIFLLKDCGQQGARARAEQ